MITCNDLSADFIDSLDDSYMSSLMDYVTELEMQLDSIQDLTESFNKLEQDLGKIRNYIGEKEYNRILESK